jgi:hypothetical protein
MQILVKDRELAEARRALAALAERVLGRVTTGRRSAGAICRLCESHACGHHAGRCPVTQAADAAEASASAAGIDGAARSVGRR